MKETNLLHDNTIVTERPDAKEAPFALRRRQGRRERPGGGSGSPGFVRSRVGYRAREEVI